MWQNFCKSLTTSMDKGQIVDSQFYGTFTKAATVKEGAQGYVYCPGAKSSFKLVENDENYREIS